jgi:predicted O-methyltransferase YrrM
MNFIFQSNNNNSKIEKVIKELYARHSEISIISSIDHNLMQQPTKYLLSLLPKLAELAAEIDILDVSNRISNNSLKYTEIWPGEHYKLLAAFVKLLKPKLVVEIGTYLGMGSLSLKKYLLSNSTLVTYDIVKWDDFKETLFNKEDFDKQLIQIIADLSNPDIFEKNKNILEDADLIFLDAPKDGKFEPNFLKLVETIKFKNNPIMIIDDIRLLNMVALWRKLNYPKLDITSLGHWSGTGILQLNSQIIK